MLGKASNGLRPGTSDRGTSILAPLRDVVISPRAAVCSVYDKLDISCVLLLQHWWISFLLTSSYCMIDSFPLILCHFPPANSIKDVVLLNKLGGMSHQLVRDHLIANFHIFFIFTHPSSLCQEPSPDHSILSLSSSSGVSQWDCHVPGFRRHGSHAKAFND